MSKTNKTNNIKNLTDDVLCALVARNEIRKLGYTPSSNPTKFSEIFHEYSDIKKSTNEKQANKLERERKKKLDKYVLENLTENDINGNPTLVVIE
jgi:hypothetical protein